MSIVTQSFVKFQVFFELHLNWKKGHEGSIEFRYDNDLKYMNLNFWDSRLWHL